ncbi:CU044_5270 family protein [Allokutzneria oryzae]|uniref:CU044_5270 family protein n=1 Tax=Allokutzneria oryzae TaxID=1378989 RepID=A0ABV5ZXV1_9PSEU
MRDEELDRALDAGLDRLADVPDMTESAFQSGRARLFAAMSESTTTPEDELTITQDAPAVTTEKSAPSRKPRRWLAAAAAVGVLTAGGLLSQAIGFDSAGEAHAEAVAKLNKAADLAAVNTDLQVGPGQYLYRALLFDGISTYSEGTASHGAGIQETWIPGDRGADWLERRADIGEPAWVPGLEGSGKPAGTPKGLLGEWRAKCGNFSYFAKGSERSCDKGDWYNPTPEFLASLPKDPQQLYQRLVAEHPHGDAAVVTGVGSLLGTGRVPADVRAALYRALALVPSMTTTADVANLDGRKGTALGVRSGKEFREIIIDPATGQYIGERSVVAEADGGLQPGTVRTSSALRTGVVADAGTPPAK